MITEIPLTTLTMAGLPVAEYQPHRWRCLVYPCAVQGRWHNDANPDRALRDHYRVNHWFTP